ncbi:hypothetical protein BGZ80_002558 [Entomortierella chlamydospora]|uniref:Uncharacterized protein n=1 Tax=Entomortierella chlamydospora TaxID=101097 RepID=A0A9P6MQ43_9FUNG|nr:hypothetical protein BGZ80_002558 [Entomortierella chlamydospora]
MHASTPLSTAQYLIAVTQGWTIYIISAIFSIAQLIQCKLSSETSNGLRLSGRVIYLPANRVSWSQLEDAEEDESDKDDNDTDLDVSDTREELTIVDRQVTEASKYQNSLSAHVAIKKLWAILAAVGDQGWYYSGTMTTVTTEQRLENQVDRMVVKEEEAKEKNQTQGSTNDATPSKDNYSNRIRRALVRTISGNLIPQIKRVTFSDQIVILDKGESLEKGQPKPSREIAGIQTTTASIKSSSSTSTSEFSLNTTKIFIQQQDVTRKRRSSNVFFPPSQMNSKPTAAPSAVIPTMFSSLMAPAAPSTVSITTATAKTTISIDTASSMLMAIPIALESAISANADHHTMEKNPGDSHGNGVTQRKRSISAPSKSSAFLQRYRQELQLRQRQLQQQEGVEAEERLMSTRPQTHEQDKQGDSNTVAIPPDNSGHGTVISISTPTPTSAYTSQSSTLGLGPLSLRTRVHQSLSLIRPHSMQLDMTSMFSSAFSDSKTQEYSTLRRKSFDNEDFKTTSSLASEAPPSSLTTEQQVSGRREEGVTVATTAVTGIEYRNLIFRLAHPHRYKREMEQQQQELSRQVPK